MAVLIPSMAGALRQDGGLYRELDLVQGLAQSLPDGYEVFHGIPLHAVHRGHDHYGEIDVVVMAPGGALLLMEVKAGPVQVRDGQVYKLYGKAECDVGRQSRLQRAGLLGRLQDADLDTSVACCLVVPDYRLTDEEAVSIARERIIDAERYPQVAMLVREWLSQGRDCQRLDVLRRFLRNQFRVTVDLATARDQLNRTTRALADGMATWVPRIAAPSGVLRVHATAGSGKTQLALRLLETAVVEGRAVAYLCYNRPLADAMRVNAPARAEVVNFHELAVDYVQRCDGELDFSQPRALEQAAERYTRDSMARVARLDVLVIDEGQDFEPAWIEAVCELLRPDGRLYLLEDQDQRLYERGDFEIAGSVDVDSYDNYRSPRLICDVINALGLSRRAVNSRSPHQGEVPGFHHYASHDQMLEQIERAVNGLLARGFALADIVVLSHRGRAGSSLTDLRQIGPWRTRQFTGKYDRHGNPLWTEGELLVESVYRYKGQSAPAVVLAELAFDVLTPQEKKKLFVGLTRAQMAVEIVLTAAAEQAMLAEMSRRDRA